MRNEAEEFLCDLPSPRSQARRIRNENPGAAGRALGTAGRGMARANPGERAARRGGWKESADPCLQPPPSLGVAGSIFLGWDLSCGAETPICRTGWGVMSRRPRPPPMRMAAVRCPSTALWTPPLAASPALHALQSAAPAGSASGMHAAAPQRRRRWGTVLDLPRAQNDRAFGIWTEADARARQHQLGGRSGVSPLPSRGAPVAWPLSSRVELVHRNRIWWWQGSKRRCGRAEEKRWAFLRAAQGCCRVLGRYLQQGGLMVRTNSSFLGHGKGWATLTGSGALGGVTDILIRPTDRTDQQQLFPSSLTKCKLLLWCFIVIIIIIMLLVRLNLSEKIVLLIKHLTSYLLESSHLTRLPFKTTNPSPNFIAMVVVCDTS